MDIYLRGMRDRSMQNGTELAREIQLKLIGQQQTNLSNWSSEVQILHDIIFVLVLSIICTLRSVVG